MKNDLDPDAIVHRQLTSERIAYRKARERKKHRLYKQLMWVSIAVLSSTIILNLPGTIKDWDIVSTIWASSASTALCTMWLHRILFQVRHHTIEKAQATWKRLTFAMSLNAGLFVISWIHQILAYSAQHVEPSSSIYLFFFCSLLVAVHVVVGLYQLHRLTSPLLRFEIHSKNIQVLTTTTYIWWYISISWATIVSVFSIS